jgi:phospholipid-binding lipoprotein MlaA
LSEIFGLLLLKARAYIIKEFLPAKRGCVMWEAQKKAKRPFRLNRASWFAKQLVSVAAVSSVVLLAACATKPPAADLEAMAEFKENNDPLEPMNRRLFDVHQAIDRTVLVPLAVGYRYISTEKIRLGVHNALQNLHTPVVLANDLLQARTTAAGATIGRFAINSTVGLLGVMDTASTLGLNHHSNDFGKTLASWGVGEGPFLFLPLIGPTNARDAFGRVTDAVADPMNWVGQGLTVDVIRNVRVGAGGIVARERLLNATTQLDGSAIDAYATYRSVGQQLRRRAIQSAE